LVAVTSAYIQPAKAKAKPDGPVHSNNQFRGSRDQAPIIRTALNATVARVSAGLLQILIHSA
jgi:hypothetical protein